MPSVHWLWRREKKIRRPENYSEGDKVQSICPAIGFPQLNISLPLRRNTVINSCSLTLPAYLSLYLSLSLLLYHYMDTECTIKYKYTYIQTNKRV